MFRYTHAVVCRIANSYSKALGITQPVDLNLAHKQHETYVRTLREIGLDVIELPADENHPDCVFVEDTAVVCNGTALITKPGHPSRAQEVEYMRAILKKELELPIVEIMNEKARLDGGDVLFTGKEFFVGLSGRTNQEGASALAAAFPEFPCTPIKVDKALHLQSVVSMAGPDILCVSETQDSQDVLKRIEREASFRYQILVVPDKMAANVVFANNTLLYRGLDFPASAKVFEQKMSHFNLRPLSLTELSKAQGDLTCCSILIRKSRHLKTIM